MNGESPAPSLAAADTLCVAGWRIYVSTNRISKDKKTAKLEPRAMKVLVYLAEHVGETVTRERLEEEVWRGMVVGYDALSNTITKLRKAFDDDPKHPQIIETIPKVGYRLIAEVSHSSAVTESPAAAKRLERKLAAILYADVAGYSRLTGEDEEGTHRILSAYLDAITEAIRHHNGEVAHYAGDAVLAEFATVVEALTCAVAIQRDLVARNASQPADRTVEFRIGINLGDVIVDRDEIYGDGVNIAARLESLADAGGICISESVRSAIGKKLPFGYEFLGEQTLKNIAEPVRAYRVLLSPQVVPAKPGPPTRRLVAGVAALVVLLTVVVLMAWFKPWDISEEPVAMDHKALPLPDKPSIAVLPFTNLSDELAKEHFADGLTDDLITDLSKISGLFVIARHSVFTYKDKPIKLRQVAEELGVRYVVEGSVRGAGGRLRINVQLIDATTGGHLWAERYEADETDVFTLQDRLIGNIVSALAVKLTDTEKTRLARRPTDNLEAYDYYLRAERRLVYSGDDVLSKLSAIRLYQEAIALDPQFAEAYARLAWVALTVWRWDSTQVMSGPTAKKLAYESASKVLSLDPDNPSVYGVFAVLQASDGQHALALESAQKAVSLDPNRAEAYVNLATVLGYAGQHVEALQMMQTAFRLDPKPPANFHGELGLALFFNGRYERAIEHLEKTRGIATTWYDEILAMTYAELGRFDEAKVTVERLYEDVPFANLAYFRTLYAHYKRKEDLEHITRALGKAGIPEWPYDYRPTVENRLDSAALEALMLGRTWVGHNFSGAPFIQQFTDDGRIALRSRASLLSGTAKIRDDMVCIRYPAALLNREDCGYVYRNPSGSPEQENEYVRVALGEIYHFSVTP